MKLHKAEVHLKRTNSVLTKKSNHKYSCQTTSYSSSNSSRKLINWDEVLNIAHPPKLSLAQMISTPHIISSQLDRLEKNYQSEYLWFEEETAQPKVLVVEDRDDDRDYLCSMLRTENFRVIEAEDSNVAIDVARSQCPDLIICDLMMPVIDGYGIQHLLRQSAITNQIPLLFVVSYSETEDSSRLVLIENESTIKPLTKPRLLAAITHKLKKAIASN